jgi:molybdopterin-guanine dinucleotide biosynthesis protein A
MTSVRANAASRPVTAAILAGGRASRFGGADKSALMVDGARIIDRQLAALSPVAQQILIVSNERERFAALGLPVVADVVPNAGPIGGLYTAIVAASHHWVLALACDMPYVSTELFEALISAATDDVDAVLPRSVRGIEPLCALYARTAAPVLRRRIDAGEWRVGDAVGDLRIREIAGDAIAGLADDSRLFENVNTPHDYARARK